MAKLSEILEYISEELNPETFQDASLNGLQIEGNKEVKVISAAVDGAESVVNSAIKINADLLLVHHGIFWGRCMPIAGPRRALIQSALEGNLSLVAMHLPLDAHQTFGNNFLLAEKLGLSKRESAIDYGGQKIGCIGLNPKTQNRDAIKQKLSALTGGSDDFVTLPFGPETPKRICVVSGSAADSLYEFQKYNFDTLISGEPKQFAYHFCKENNLNAFFAGHYATETLGVCALAEAIAKKFNITWNFIDEPSGI